MKMEEHTEMDQRYMFLNWGFNVRPTELQAGFGLEQLKRWPSFHSQRLKNVNYFQAQFKDFRDFMCLMEVSQDADCSWLALPIMLTPECPFSKDDFLKYLEANGIETRPIVAGNIARQPACKLFPELQDNNLPGADLVHTRGFYIGLHPIDNNKKLDRIIDLFHKFIKENS
jgi:CDP-6-deoxy-D-xylo-4-hexulose-3-dehydrase